jgi:phage shock protein PspC (stress-responsive transcriptional regulator)
MQRVISVSLNRNVYHFEEDAHARLAEYLDRAQRRLAAYPDRAEVLADVEQAISDQCSRRLAAGQSVITLVELGAALDEIGEVEIPGAPGPMPGGEAPGNDPAAPGTANALQQISEGAWISGVCQGLAKSSRLDVTLLRVIAVLLLVFSGGGMILLYAVLMLLIPYAPLSPNAAPLPWLPAKSREIVTAIRSKLATLTG